MKGRRHERQTKGDLVEKYFIYSSTLLPLFCRRDGAHILNRSQPSMLRYFEMLLQTEIRYNMQRLLQGRLLVGDLLSNLLELLATFLELTPQVLGNFIAAFINKLIRSEKGPLKNFLYRPIIVWFWSRIHREE
eukprot:scaffold407_cov168-Amphora_coffeaeformis.AAC.5